MIPGFKREHIMEIFAFAFDQKFPVKSLAFWHGGTNIHAVNESNVKIFLQDIGAKHLTLDSVTGELDNTGFTPLAWQELITRLEDETGKELYKWKSRS